VEVEVLDEGGREVFPRESLMMMKKKLKREKKGLKKR